jgi:hypothetical protein
MHGPAGHLLGQQNIFHAAALAQAWLRSAGLSAHAAVFAENEVDGEVLVGLGRIAAYCTTTHPLYTRFF